MSAPGEIDLPETVPLTTQLAVDAIAWGRAPRHPGSLRVNLRVVCEDGFAVSIQASSHHYANDQTGSPYWRLEDDRVFYPFTTFELGYPTGDDDLSSLAEWESGGVWAWVPREAVVALLDSHGGAVSWEPSREKS